MRVFLVVSVALVGLFSSQCSLFAKLKFPLAVLALSLFPLGKACAIGITINPTTYMSSTAVGLALPLVEDIYQPTSSDPFAISTSAVSGVSISNATWSFVNTNASAIFSGNFFLSASGTEGSTIATRVYTLFDFALTKSATYSISGNLSWSIFSEGQSSVGEIAASFLTGISLGTFYTLIRTSRAQRPQLNSIMPVSPKDQTPEPLQRGCIVSSFLARSGTDSAQEVTAALILR